MAGPAANRTAVFLVLKKSFYHIYGVDQEDPHFMGLIRSRKRVARQLKQAHDENEAVIGSVLEYFDSRGIPVVLGDFDQVPPPHCGLVVAVGGDGTLLAASHHALDIPVVGINSRPGKSVGYFCIADGTNFSPVLDEIAQNSRQPRKLMRMDVAINGRRRSPPILNDLLFSAECPASSTMYLLRVGDLEEMQKGAGIWISTPAGSTGGIRSAGGHPMALDEDQMQFLVREPYAGDQRDYGLEAGPFLSGVVITNLTPHAALFVDGARIVHRLNYGDTIEPLVSRNPLLIYL